MRGMQKKLLVGLAAIALAVPVISSLVDFARFGPQVAAMDEATVAGQAHGEDLEDLDCLTAARAGQWEGEAMAWTTGCLQTATETEGFCSALAELPACEDADCELATGVATNRCEGKALLSRLAEGDPEVNAAAAAFEGDQLACLEHVRAQELQTGVLGLGDQLEWRQWARTCLAEATPNPAICDDVPAYPMPRGWGAQSCGEDAACAIAKEAAHQACLERREGSQREG